MDLEQLLRLAPTPDAAEPPAAAFRAFRAASASPLAPDVVQIVAQDASSSAQQTFAAPALPSPAAFAAPRQELERLARPLFALENLGGGGLNVSAQPRASRFLVQLPMAPPRAELVPQRAGLVLRPLALTYEFRAVNSERAAAAAEFASALAKQDEYARGKMTNAPFAPGGESLVELEGAAAQAHVAAGDPFASPEEAARNDLVLGGELDLDDYVRELVMTAEQ